MSIHSSLKFSGALSGMRNVWTRVERIAALKKAGKWADGDDVTGLPKVRTGFKTKSKKQLKAEAAAEKVTEAEEAGEAKAAESSDP